MLAMAGRELRAARARLLLYGSCMALGIAALVSLHGFRSATLATVDAEARELLGADLMLTSRTPFEGAALAAIQRLERESGREAARITVFGSMALSEPAGRTRMVEVRGVEGAFPFYGELLTAPAGRWDALLAERGGAAEPLVLVDPAILVQLDTKLGDGLRLGQLRFEIAGEVTKAPGGVGLRQSVAPRVYVPGGLVEETGLIERGSLVEYLAYFAVDDPGLLEGWLARERAALEGQRVRIRTVASHRDELSGSLSGFTRFLGLVGLVALLLGGVGVAAGVRAFAREKVDTAALLRALGASQNEVLAIYALQAAALGIAGALVGTAIGLLAQLALPTVLAALLPIEVPFRVVPAVLVVAFGLGLWVAVLFALWPLLELGTVPPLRALRRDFAPEASGRAPSRGSVAIVLALGTTLVAAAVWQAPTLLSGLAFAGGFAAALLVLALCARGAIAALRGAVPPHAPYWLRQGVANLFRPRNQTGPVVLAIGAGVFLVATLHLVERSLLESLERDEGEARPNLVLFDVQSDQRQDVVRRLEERGAPLLETAPIVSARIAGLNNESVSRLLADSSGRGEGSRRWALGREYRLTYATELRPSETIVAGEWWDTEGRAASIGGDYPLVSLEDELAETLGVGVGDAIFWDIQGVRVPSRVGSLREVDWGRLATNFFVVFAPGTLEYAPQSFVLLSRVEGERERAELQRDLVLAHPNLAALDATVILRAVDAIIDELGVAVRFMAGYSLATGFAILIAAITTSRYQRARETLLLRTIGADGRTVRGVITAEHVALGALAATVGLALAYLAAWCLMTFWFEIPLAASPWGPLLLWAAVLLVCLGAGRANTRGALREAPPRRAAPSGRELASRRGPSRRVCDGRGSLVLGQLFEQAHGGVDEAGGALAAVEGQAGLVAAAIVVVGLEQVAQPVVRVGRDHQGLAIRCDRSALAQGPGDADAQLEGRREEPQRADPQADQRAALGQEAARRHAHDRRPDPGAAALVDVEWGRLERAFGERDAGEPAGLGSALEQPRCEGCAEAAGRLGLRLDLVRELVRPIEGRVLVGDRSRHEDRHAAACVLDPTPGLAREVGIDLQVLGREDRRVRGEREERCDRLLARVDPQRDDLGIGARAAAAVGTEPGGTRAHQREGGGARPFARSPQRRGGGFEDRLARVRIEAAEHEPLGHPVVEVAAGPRVGVRRDRD